MTKKKYIVKNNYWAYWSIGTTKTKAITQEESDMFEQKDVKKNENY